jgi:hypothetical protein
MENEFFECNERYTISVFNDSCSDHLPNRDEEIDMTYHWQIKIKDKQPNAIKGDLRNIDQLLFLFLLLLSLFISNLNNISLFLFRSVHRDNETDYLL